VFVSRSRIDTKGKSWREIARELNTSTASARRRYQLEVAHG
jgi:hypothetical protein